MEQGWLCPVLHSCSSYLLLTITLRITDGVETSKWLIQSCVSCVHFLFCAICHLYWIMHSFLACLHNANHALLYSYTNFVLFPATAYFVTSFMFWCSLFWLVKIISVCKLNVACMISSYLTVPTNSWLLQMFIPWSLWFLVSFISLRWNSISIDP